MSPDTAQRGVMSLWPRRRRRRKRRTCPEQLYLPQHHPGQAYRRICDLVEACALQGDECYQEACLIVPWPVLSDDRHQLWCDELWCDTVRILLEYEVTKALNARRMRPVAYIHAVPAVEQKTA
jgi:hypothetical protein